MIFSHPTTQDRLIKGFFDDEVLDYATLNDRSVITFNRDDFVALHRNGVNHAGIIICKDDRDYLGQAQALHDYLETHSPTHAYDRYVINFFDMEEEEARTWSFDEHY